MSRNKRSFLLLCTEWSAAHGGLPAFNRLLAKALASAGHRTGCLVLHASEAEREDARRCGVELLTAQDMPSEPTLYLPGQDAVDFRPDVVVGHDRFSGPHAWAYARQHPAARLVLIMHTATSEIERYKDPVAATARTEERERIAVRIAQDAAVVAAVGPRLRRAVADLLEDGSGSFPVLELDPGLGPIVPEIRRPPARPNVLVLGRTDDLTLKGLDLAARAVAAAPDVDGVPPGLLVRGAPADLCDRLHAELTGIAGLARERVDVRPFTTDPEQLARDQRRSAVCLLTSRIEGFGLSALDAVAAGTPVLLSGKSGVAELLRCRLGRLVEPLIVEPTDHLPTDVRRWGDALAGVLRDLPAAFAHAQDVRERLAGQLSWSDTAAALAEACDRVHSTTALAPGSCQ